MTNDEIRRTKLKELISENGSVAAVARAMGLSSSQVSQWKNASPDSKTGKPRVMQDSSARRMEDVFGKPRGWMDIASPPAYAPHILQLNDKPIDNKYQDHIIHAEAKTLAQQAAEVAQLWMDLSVDQRREVLDALRAKSNKPNPRKGTPAPARRPRRTSAQKLKVGGD